MSKSSITIVLLNALALNRIVVSGLCLFINPWKQPSPANLLSIHLHGNVHSKFCHNRMSADGFVYMSFRNSCWNIYLCITLTSIPSFRWRFVDLCDVNLTHWTDCTRHHCWFFKFCNTVLRVPLRIWNLQLVGKACFLVQLWRLLV